MRVLPKSNTPCITAAEMFHVKHCVPETALMIHRALNKSGLFADAKIAKNNIEQILDTNPTGDAP